MYPTARCHAFGFTKQPQDLVRPDTYHADQSPGTPPRHSNANNQRRRSNRKKKGRQFHPPARTTLPSSKRTRSTRHRPRHLPRRHRRQKWQQQEETKREDATRRVRSSSPVLRAGASLSSPEERIVRHAFRARLLCQKAQMPSGHGKTEVGVDIIMRSALMPSPGALSSGRAVRTPVEIISEGGLCRWPVSVG